MNCSVCGGENSTGARFCKHCGAPVASVMPVAPASGAIACPNCGKSNKPGAKFCTSCSASLGSEISLSSLPLVEGTVACQKCGAANKVSAAFCVGCGQGLAKGDAEVETPIMVRLFDQKAAASLTPTPAPKAATADATEKNEHVEMRKMGKDDETHAKSGLIRTKSKPILWVLVAIAIGAVAGGSYSYFTRKPSAPIQLPAHLPVPRVAQKPVPEIRPSLPNTQAMPPQLVSPTSNVDTHVASIKSAAPDATIGQNAEAQKSATSKPSSAKKMQHAVRSSSRETHAATSHASKNVPTTDSNSQFKSSSPSKSETDSPVATSVKSTFELELEECRKMGLFERGICTERAKWKYCNITGVWDDNKPGCKIN